MRGGRPDTIAKAMASIVSSPSLDLVFVDDALFDAALRIYQIYERLSFTDAVTVTVMQKRKIKEIFSHDEDFDLKGILRRERPD
jgi:predicted nucleic acid-binding protein